MVTSKKPVAAKPADQFISLIKAPDKKEVAAQKTVTKGSAEKKTEEISEKKASAASTSTREKEQKRLSLRRNHRIIKRARQENSRHRTRREKNYKKT